MPTVHPQASHLIDEYIKKAPVFAQPICTKLRQIIRKADPGIVEDWKWGPNFNKKGMVCGFSAFKEHVSFVFFQGAMLKDPKKILALGGSNVHNRTVKFMGLKDIDEKTLIAYIKEAVAPNTRGVKAQPEKKQVTVPADLKKALAANKKAHANFEQLAYTYRKEYIKWIEEAEQPETRQRKIQQTVGKVAAGKKMHEKYTK
jgi:uncharacterized protein YdeI (YjbR/CyaY-like superfamily)